MIAAHSTLSTLNLSVNDLSEIAIVLCIFRLSVHLIGCWCQAVTCINFVLYAMVFLLKNPEACSLVVVQVLYVFLLHGQQETYFYFQLQEL